MKIQHTTESFAAITSVVVIRDNLYIVIVAVVGGNSLNGLVFDFIDVKLQVLGVAGNLSETYAPFCMAAQGMCEHNKFLFNSEELVFQRVGRDAQLQQTTSYMLSRPGAAFS